MPRSLGQWSGGSTRRSGRTDIFHDVRETEDKERFMQLAESLMSHELSKRANRKFIILKRAHLLKFLLMIISICAFLVLMHADFNRESIATFLVQLGTSTPLFPSIFRVSTTHLRLDLTSPIIDYLILFIVAVHQLMAVTAFLFILKTSGSDHRDLLFFNVALLLAGVSICLIEIGGVIFSAQIQGRSSSSWANSMRDGEPNQPGPALL